MTKLRTLCLIGALTLAAVAQAAPAGGPIPSSEKLLDAQSLKQKLVGKYLYPSKPSASDASLNEFFYPNGDWKLSSDAYSLTGAYTILAESYCVKRPGNELCFAITLGEDNLYRLYRLAANGGRSLMFEVSLTDDFHGAKAPPALPKNAAP